MMEPEEDIPMNPSPPHVLTDVEEEVLHGDAIPGTTFSRQFIIRVLRSWLEALERGTYAAPSEEAPPLELDKELEDSLVELWDMCVTPEVSFVLWELEICQLIAATSRDVYAPRFVEISLGILYNLSCIPELVTRIMTNDAWGLVRSVSALLTSSDTPTLVLLVKTLYTWLRHCRGTNISPPVALLECLKAEALDEILRDSRNEELLLSSLNLAFFMENDCDLPLNLATSSHDLNPCSSLIEAVSQIATLHSDSPETMKGLRQASYLVGTILHRHPEARTRCEGYAKFSEPFNIALHDLASLDQLEEPDHIACLFGYQTLAPLLYTPPFKWISPLLRILNRSHVDGASEPSKMIRCTLTSIVEASLVDSDMTETLKDYLRSTLSGDQNGKVRAVEIHFKIFRDIPLTVEDGITETKTDHTIYNLPKF
ncbi:unnamed protein product [Cyprideis torosa]|uniref:Uncharacterized protein n=1 Tax=Cyprideis torosa TaxID=163714 RepID=A0A7R8W934_9CRUS|nr:unnamed protein product [Cyprideis torosa]CAG0884449.1 unnamed protein product [Cyprideis torosa]